ncbi:RtcB family protein [Xenorhabdus budapestensis]|uniref:3'-phosphate/5'-hydroxy nucleic acid ligase n=1 Tax=Xenorhabdus budapestensis TaxID=290110 RepID=A0ABX7VGH0_XENBU|nr:RtcB family protein [Xenorhabdus budapestensis]QTL39550.1 RtcB family protein [Xenorhabdus budapestensis]
MKTTEIKTNGYNLLTQENGAPVKMWANGVPVDPKAITQLQNTAKMLFVFKHMAVMPDVHFGKGSTIGSVIPTGGAIIPAEVGVDIGCGMIAVRTSLVASDLPDNLLNIRHAIEVAVPHGRNINRGGRDKGSWHDAPEMKKRFTVSDQKRATAHVECRKDSDVIDEIPMAYKDIDAVMAAQSSLVKVVHTLR